MINDLTEAVGWGRRPDSKWLQIIEKSSHLGYILGEDGQLRAFGRILEDGVMCMFYDICVHPDWQDKGLGSLIMENLVTTVKDKDYVSIGLFVWDKNEKSKEFYRKFGFESVNTGMELSKYMAPE